MNFIYFGRKKELAMFNFLIFYVPSNMAKETLFWEKKFQKKSPHFFHESDEIAKIFAKGGHILCFFFFEEIIILS